MPTISGTVPGDAFAQAVSQVIIAASKDDTLPILTGVRMEIEDDLITLLATDRYRLAMREVPWKPVTPGISTSALVKAKTLNEVAKTLGNSGDINLALADDDSRLIGFESGGRTTTSLLVDGDYPKIRSLFPDIDPHPRHCPDAGTGRSSPPCVPRGRTQHPGPSRLHRRDSCTSMPAPARTPRPPKSSKPS